MTQIVDEASGQPGASPAVRRLLFGCSRCSERWNGKKTAHCGQCHTTFSGPSAFDQHRSAGICSSERGMLARGLAKQERAGYVVWGFAQQDERWDNEEDEGEDEC